MAHEKTDRQLNGSFALLHASYYCIIAVNVGFFSLLLSKIGYSDTMIGQVAVATSIVGLFAPPLMGQLCDRWQLNKLLFIVAAVVAPAAFFVIQHAHGFWVVVLCAVVFYACCISVQSVPGGWIAALNADGHNINFSFTRSFGSLSFALISIVIGLIVGKCGIESLPLLLVAFGGMLVAAVLPLPTQPKQTPQKERSVKFIPALKVLLRNKPYVLLLLCSILYTIPGSVFFTYFAVYFSQLGGTASWLGVAMFILAVVEVPVMLLYGRLEKVIPVAWLVAISMVGYAVRGICISLAPNATWLTASLLLQVFGLALSVPACQSFIAACTPPEYSSTAQTLAFAVGGFGTILANVLSTWLVSVTNIKNVFHITSYFALAGAVIFILFVCLPLTCKKVREHS